MMMLNSMKPSVLAARIAAVRQRHRQVDESVRSEQIRPMPDASALQSLKRRRLQLKDELQRYEGLVRTLSRGRITP